MQFNRFVFVGITKEWEVWIYSTDLLVNVDHN